jgi:hypothetical protein
MGNLKNNETIRHQSFLSWDFPGKEFVEFVEALGFLI